MMKLIIIQVAILVMSSLVHAAETEVVLNKESQPILIEPVEKKEAQTSNLNEEEIPLNVDLSKKANENSSTSSRLIITFFILSAVIGTTYLVVRKYKLSNHINKSNKQIKIISQHYLGPKKSLAIIHVAGESMLIGVTESNISMIKSLSLIDDEVPPNLPQNFSDTLQLKSQPAAGASAQQVQPDELDEEFSFAGVRDSVSKKIKSMRSFS